MTRRPEEEPRRPEPPVLERSGRRRTQPEPAAGSSGTRPTSYSVKRAASAAVAGLVLAACGVWWEPSTPVAVEQIEVRPAPAAADLAPTLELPGPVDERVDYWIQHFVTDDRQTFEEFLSRESIYGEVIREKLRARGMPEDLLYLAMIESGFSTRATSRTQASGLWQFMGPTAREYGLEVGEFVDERRDPLKATDAALDYLERLNDRFGSWYLAAAAYNAGPTRVARAVRTAGDSDLEDHEVFWDIVDHLPPETRAYVSRLLAAVLLAKEAEEYGFHVERPKPYEFERVWVPGETSLQRVAEAVELPVAVLRDLNPHLIRDRTPPGTSYGIRVPPGKAPEVVASLGNEWALADD